MKMNLRLSWRPRRLGLVGFFLIFGLNFKGNSSLTAPTPSGIRKNYCNLNLSSGDFCLEHSMADFRVYFQDFRKEFMIFKSYLDSSSAFDVCQNPSLRQNTMIPLILSPRYNIWQLSGNDNDGAPILQTLRLQRNSNSHPGTIHDDSYED